MPKIDTVKPGDQIKADFMNALVAYVEGLESRIATLENAKPGKVRIDTITPDPTITENDIVTIVGANFSSKTEENSVTVGDFLITQFKAFGGSQLIQFDMPHIPSIASPSGSLVSITVRNKEGTSDSKTRTVRNKIPLPGGSGKVLYNQVSVPNGDGLIHATDQVTLTFRVSATATLEGSYQITAENDQGWPMQIVGPNPFPLQAAPSGTSSTKDVTVLVTVPNGTANNAKSVVSVSAKEITPGSTVSFIAAPDVTLTVNQAPPSPDTGVVLAPGPVFHGSFSGGTLVFDKTNFTFGSVALNLTFNKIGSYLITFSMKKADGWTLSASNNVAPPATNVVTAPTLISPSATWQWDTAKATSTEMTVTISKDTGEVVAQYPVPVALQ